MQKAISLEQSSSSAICGKSTQRNDQEGFVGCSEVLGNREKGSIHMDSGAKEPQD